MRKISIKLPDDYHADTKSNMKLIIAYLAENRAITNVDKLALRMLASNLNDFFKADDELLTSTMIKEKEGGGVEPNRLLKIKNDAQIQAFKLMQEFGLMLKSRERIKAVNTEVEEESGIIQLAKSRIDDRAKK